MSAPETTATDVYSRVTLVGTTRRVDLVLPSHQPVGSLMADVLTILEERPGLARTALVSVTGGVVAPDDTLAGAGVVDGSVLRLVVEDMVPPPPVVNDVTEETSDDLDRRGGRLGPISRRILAVCGLSLAAAIAVFTAASTTGDRGDARAILLAAAAGFGLAHLWTSWRRLVWAAAGTAIGGSVLLAGGLALLGSARGWATADIWAIVIACGWLGTAAVATARRRVGAAAGAGLGIVLAGGWLALRRTALHDVEVDAIVAALAAMLFGVLPRWALTVSGLASLDDRRADGTSVRRAFLTRSLVDAHGSLVTAGVAVCAAAALTGVRLAADTRVWPMLLAGTVAVVFVLRARTFPLISEVALALAASAAIGVAMVLVWVPRSDNAIAPVSASVVLALVSLLALVWQPASHVRARLRELADLVEAIAVIALVPMLVGIFGVFARLVHTF